MSVAIATTGFGVQARFQPASQSGAGTEASPKVRTRLRLTRRGRVVFTAIAAIPLVVLALVMVLGAGGAAAESDAAGPATAFEYVTVDRGDSLWGIAEAIAPDADPRVVIDEIIRLNGLDGAVVEPGQRLALPVLP
ncbi:LysM peptidoglycan-binding domain-containing protein [Agromyces ramosus]|uniref:Nucleoid-associated protein YgaU n=1 Tax=Agromyces ramosus TaxID=33879 RepID=A0ABU0RD81_9MICO|nr:LysM peptidoglycan-binding domain-containing protein [Agromyces ramosus]MDQ0895722.1 nucleoid-associated protein YgaU [Agromyces ramosus]